MKTIDNAPTTTPQRDTPSEVGEVVVNVVVNRYGLNMRDGVPTVVPSENSPTKCNPNVKADISVTGQTPQVIEMDDQGEVVREWQDF